LPEQQSVPIEHVEPVGLQAAAAQEPD